MIINCQPDNNATLYINDQSVERTNKFKYLGFTLNDKWDSSREVKIKVTMVKIIFIRFDISFDIIPNLRLHVIRCYI